MLLVWLRCEEAWNDVQENEKVHHEKRRGERILMVAKTSREDLATKIFIVSKCRLATDFGLEDEHFRSTSQANFYEMNAI